MKLPIGEGGRAKVCNCSEISHTNEEECYNGQDIHMAKCLKRTNGPILLSIYCGHSSDPIKCPNIMTMAKCHNDTMTIPDL